MITPLPENFLALLLPQAVTDLDVQGRLAGTLNGIQERQGDLRAFITNLQAMWTPIHRPLNSCVQTTFTDFQGKVVQRNVLESDLVGQPELEAFRAGTLSPDDAAAWMAFNLDLDPRQIISVLPYLDPEKKPIDPFEGLMAKTLGAPVPPGDEDLATLPGLVQAWMSLVHVRGTPASMEAIGRLSGLDSCTVTPLWQRLSPRDATAMDLAVNDQDFAVSPDAFPGTAAWDPLSYRTGPFYQWTSTAAPDAVETWLGFMLACPFVNWFILGIPAREAHSRGAWSSNATYDRGDIVTKDNQVWIASVIPIGTTFDESWKPLTFPTGRFFLEGGAPNVPSSVDMGSFTASGKAEGPSFDGLAIDSSGSWNLSIIDQLSLIQYRSSWMDVSGFVDQPDSSDPADFLRAIDASNKAMTQAMPAIDALKPATRWIRNSSSGINLTPDPIEWSPTLNQHDIPWRTTPIPGAGIDGSTVQVWFQAQGSTLFEPMVGKLLDSGLVEFSVPGYSFQLNLKTGEADYTLTPNTPVIRVQWTYPPVVIDPSNPPTQGDVDNGLVQDFDRPTDDLSGPFETTMDVIDWSKVPLLGGQVTPVFPNGLHSAVVFDQSGTPWSVRLKMVPGQSTLPSTDPDWQPPMVELVPADLDTPVAPVISNLNAVGLTTGLIYGQLVAMPERFGNAFLRDLVAWVPMLEHRSSPLRITRMAPTEAQVEITPTLVPNDRVWTVAGWTLDATQQDKKLKIPVQAHSDGTISCSLNINFTLDTTVEIVIGSLILTADVGTTGNAVGWTTIRWRVLTDRIQTQWGLVATIPGTTDIHITPLDPFDITEVELTVHAAQFRDFRLWSVVKTLTDLNAMFRVPAFGPLLNPTLIYDDLGNSSYLKVYLINFVFPGPQPVIPLRSTIPPYGQDGGTNDTLGSDQGSFRPSTLYDFDPVYDGDGHRIDDIPTNEYGWGGGTNPQVPWQLGNAVDQLTALGEKAVGSPNPMVNPNLTTIYLQGDDGIYQMTLTLNTSGRATPVLVKTEIPLNPGPGILEWPGCPITVLVDPFDSRVISVHDVGAGPVLYKTTTTAPGTPAVPIYSSESQVVSATGLDNLVFVSEVSKEAGKPTLDSAGNLSWSFTNSVTGSIRVTIRAHNVGQVATGFTGFDVDLYALGASRGATHLQTVDHATTNPAVVGSSIFESGTDNLISIDWTGLIDDPTRGIFYSLQVDQLLVEKLDSTLWTLGQNLLWVSASGSGGLAKVFNEDGTLSGTIVEYDPVTKPVVPGTTSPWTAAATVTGCTVDRDDVVMMDPAWPGPKVVPDPPVKPPPAVVPLNPHSGTMQVGDTVTYIVPASTDFRAAVFTWWDGTITTIEPGTSVDKVVNVGGSLLVTMTVVDEFGQTAISTQTLTVNKPPVITAVRISVNDAPAPYTTQVDFDINDPDGTGPISVLFDGQSQLITAQSGGHTSGTASFTITVPDTATYVVTATDSDNGVTEFPVSFRAEPVLPVLLAVQAIPLVVKSSPLSPLELMAWMTDSNRPTPATASIDFQFLAADDWIIAPLLSLPGFISISGGAQISQSGIAIVQGQAQFQVIVSSMDGQSSGPKIIHAIVHATTTAIATVQVTVIPNQFPVIDGFQITPEIIVAGSPITIEAIAHDPDGDLLVYSWTFSNGTPPGPILANPASVTPSSSVIQGQVKVSDPYGAVTTMDIPAVIVTSSDKVNAYLNRAFLYVMNAMSPIAPTWTLTGTLPPGLSFGVDRITGTPTLLGSWTVTIMASEGSVTASQQVTIVVVDSPTPPLTPTNLQINGSGTNPRFSDGQALVITWTVTNDTGAVPGSSIELRSAIGELKLTIEVNPGIGVVSVPFTTIVQRFGTPQDVVVMVYANRDGVRSVFAAQSRAVYVPG